ncbi:MAG TPA: ABC transporter ATP-binding protein [Halanaerobiales bacterium]|nr:ABC transporter ATP-binding protein [Halanaerobiales bacterium]
MKNILETRNLSKSYLVNERTKPVLKGIDLSIKEGEFVSVMGPSGSGKSTLLYNVSGMDKMTEGEVIFAGSKINELSEKDLSKLRLKKMGFVFQQINLLKNLGIIDNIILSAYMADEFEKDEINKKAIALMEKTGIEDLADNDITQASGGQLQRAAICRALINDPLVLFGDEPTGALNSKAASNIMDIFHSINEEGTTVMMVTHDVKVASQSERVLFMLDGNIEGEYILGKFDRTKNDIKRREAELSEWLLEKGF